MGWINERPDAGRAECLVSRWSWCRYGVDMIVFLLGVVFLLTVAVAVAVAIATAVMVPVGGVDRVVVVLVLAFIAR